MTFFRFPTRASWVAAVGLPVFMVAGQAAPGKKEPAKKEPAPKAAAAKKPAPEPPKPKPAWKVVDYRGLAYVDFNDVAAFFDFPTVKREGNHITLQQEKHLEDGSKRIVEWKSQAGTKLVSLNKLKFYLSYPVVRWRDGRLLLSAFDLIHVIDPILRPDQQREPSQLKVVVIDPARGGPEAGVTTAFAKEKDVTLDLAKRLKPLLEKQGLRVVLTRSEDVAVPGPQRTALAGALEEEAILLSLHCSYGNEREKGIEMFTLAPSATPSTTGDEGKVPDQKFYPGNINDRESMALATAVQGTLINQLKAGDLGIRRARFEELKAIAMPAVVCSVGRLANPEEGKKLGADSGYRQKMAASLAMGVSRYALVMAAGSAPRDRILKFGKVETLPESKGPTTGELIRVKAIISKTQPDAQIDPKKVALQVYFLDQVNREEIDLSSCNTPQAKWVSVMPNWQDAKYEEVEFLYEQPAPDAATQKLLGLRNYYGYVLRLVYADELMDEYAEPSNVRRGLGNFTAVVPRRR